VSLLLFDSVQKQQEETVFFEDGIRKIDYILTFTIDDKERDEKHADDREKRKRKREAFFSKFKENGLEYETQDCAVSIEVPTVAMDFVKVNQCFAYQFLADHYVCDLY